MPAPTAEKLYTPTILGLAVDLAEVQFDDNAPLLGHARSITCGSTVAISCTVDADGHLCDPGLRVNACAMGQASSALFARHAPGLDVAEIGLHLDAIGHWLKDGTRPLPFSWLHVLAPARAYPARHEAILLPWRAALDALSKGHAAR